MTRIALDLLGTTVVWFVVWRVVRRVAGRPFAGRVMTQHTPGPWRVIEQREGFPPYDRTVVHGLTNGTVAVRMTVADARLIAAAPEIAHELRIMVQRYETLAALTKSTGDIADTKDARALLARIEGNTNG